MLAEGAEIATDCSMVDAASNKDTRKGPKWLIASDHPFGPALWDPGNPERDKNGTNDVELLGTRYLLSMLDAVSNP
jgi:hypothetical protein